MQDRLDTPQSEGEAFRRVWQRVQGQPGPGDYLIPEGPGERPLPPAPPKPQPPQPPSGPPRPPAGPDMEGLLRRIMEELSETACLCRRWQRLWGIAQRCDGQIRRLSAALFLLTGRRWRPGTLRCQAGGFLEYCRTLYFRFQTLEQDCRRGAEETEEPELRSLFRELAQECRISREQLRRLVEETV